MWYLLVMVALPIQEVDRYPVFMFNESFETSAECIQWSNDNVQLIAYTLMQEYPKATGHDGIYCAPEDTLTQMYEDGFLWKEQQGLSL